MNAFGQGDHRTAREPHTCDPHYGLKSFTDGLKADCALYPCPRLSNSLETYDTSLKKYPKDVSSNASSGIMDRYTFDERVQRGYPNGSTHLQPSGSSMANQELLDWLGKSSRRPGIYRIGFKPSAGYSSGLGSVTNPSKKHTRCLKLTGPLGWFPFLFYSTTWVGETYFRYTPEASIADSTDPLGDIGRIGSLSLLIFSIVTFIGSVLLPFVVRAPDDDAKPRQRSFTPRSSPANAPLANLMSDAKPDLLTAWMLSHIIFAGAMFLAPFVRSLHMATVLVSICGIPWALACWAPFSFMGTEVNRMTAPSTMLANGSSYRRLPNPSDDFSSIPPSPSFLRLNHLDREMDNDDDEEAGEVGASTGETAGIYIGILNLFTTLPQFVGTFISMIVFEILEPGKHPELHKGEDVNAEGKDDVVKKVTEGPNAIASLSDLAHGDDRMTGTTPEGIGSREVERRLILPCFKGTRASDQGRSLDFDSDLTGPPTPNPIASSAYFPWVAQGWDTSSTARAHAARCRCLHKQAAE
ncbi:MAG: hypothetical protein Q9173_003485 [Seirophora scorigena]